MSRMYQFLICTLGQYAQLKDDLGWDLGNPRAGPDGRFLTSLNGGLSFTSEQLDFAVKNGIEIVPIDLIEAWLSDNHWSNEPSAEW